MTPTTDIDRPPAAGDVHPSLVPLYEEIADCPNCALARTRTQTVPGSGPPDAEIMFVGEGPGAQEDAQGLPFVGRAGQFLEELLGEIGLRRADVYITNVVKCRPPGNRDPEPVEIDACRPFLDRQFALVDPLIVVTLGRFALSRWLPDARITRVHGEPHELADGRILVPMYHPAAALRTPALRDIMRQDFAQLPALIERQRARREAAAQ